MLSPQTSAADPTPRVSLVIVNLDGRHHLEKLLASVRVQTMPAAEFEILVVDNASVDGSVAYLRAEHPDVRILENARNEGFAGPCNQGAAAARGQYLAFVNNDMRLAPDWLERFVAYLDAAPPDMVCAGSLILNWDGSHIDFMGASLAFNGMGSQDRFGEPVTAIGPADYPRELPFACGGAMLVSRQAFLETGGFDADFFAYLEDVDFGWRLWAQGYRVGFCPDAVSYHLHNGTSGQFGFPKRLVLLERNALFAVFKNYSDASLQHVLPAVLLLAFKRVAARSGMKRNDWRLAPSLAPAAPPLPAASLAEVFAAPNIGIAHEPLAAPPKTPFPTRALRFAMRVGRLGPKAGSREVASKVARKVLERWGDGPSALPAIRPEAYAGVVAVEDFIDHLPALLEKRRAVQARRKRSDEAVFAVFKQPFIAIESDPDYVRAQATLAGAFGVEELFRQACPAGTRGD